MLRNKFVTISFLLFLPCFGFSNELIELHYGRYTFNVPNPIVLRSYGDKNILTLVYEFEHEDRDFSFYNKELSFMQMDKEAISLDLESQPNCSLGLLLNDVFNNKHESGCSQEYRDVYYKYRFLQGNDHGTWPGKEVSIYYEIIDSKITVNLISNEYPDIMIQATKMTKEEVKAILSNYIAE